MPMKLMKQNKGWRPLGRLFASWIFGLIPYRHRYCTYLYYWEGPRGIGYKIMLFLSSVVLFCHHWNGCVFVIFTTGIVLNKRNKHPFRLTGSSTFKTARVFEKASFLERWSSAHASILPMASSKKKGSLSLLFPGEPQKHIRNSARFLPPWECGDPGRAFLDWGERYFWFPGHL